MRDKKFIITTNLFGSDKHRGVMIGEEGNGRIVKLDIGVIVNIDKSNFYPASNDIYEKVKSDPPSFWELNHYKMNSLLIIDICGNRKFMFDFDVNKNSLLLFGTVAWAGTEEANRILFYVLNQLIENREQDNIFSKNESYCITQLLCSLAFNIRMCLEQRDDAIDFLDSVINVSDYKRIRDSMQNYLSIDGMIEKTALTNLNYIMDYKEKGKTWMNYFFEPTGIMDYQILKDY